MKMLRKTIKAVVIVALLKIVTVILDKLSPSSSVFHRQLLFSMQVVVIAWFILSLLLYAFKAGSSWVARFLPILIILVVLIVDIFFTYWMEHPAKVPKGLKTQFKNYYASYERNMIEYEPCSVYDTAYGYRLIPGLAFAFGNNEYKNNYRVNSESLRDDEAALSGADVVCAGNSYTFGVGVEQGQDFPALLGAKTGLNVLNAGCPSFGTVRELKRVVGTDTSIMRYLIVQYSKYDVYENAAYVNSHDSLKIQSEADYKNALKRYRWAREYFPGKYAITISYDYLKSVINRFRKKRYYLSEDAGVSAKYFLQVIDKFKISDRVKILVTEVHDNNDMDSGFLHAVDSVVQKGFPQMKDRVKTVNLSSAITGDDYYNIDAHLRASGQRKIADMISAYIQSDSTSENAAQ